MPQLDGVDVRPPYTFPKDQESRIGTLRGTLPGIPPRQKLFLEITLKIPPSAAFCRTDNGLKKAKNKRRSYVSWKKGAYPFSHHLPFSVCHDVIRLCADGGPNVGSPGDHSRTDNHSGGADLSTGKPEPEFIWYDAARAGSADKSIATAVH